MKPSSDSVGGRGHDHVHPTKYSDVDSLQFMTPETTAKWCSCTNPQCFGAGYFPGGAIQIPAKLKELCLSTPNLFDSETKQKFKSKSKLPMSLYPWHFYPEHVEKNQDGKWKLVEVTSNSKFYDTDRRVYPFPPPRNTPQHFIRDSPEFPSLRVRPQDRWQSDSVSIPVWMLDMLEKDGSGISDKALDDMSKSDLIQLVKRWKARTLHQLEESKKNETKYSNQLAQQLAGNKRKYDDMKNHYEENIKKLKAEIATLNKHVENLSEALAKTRDLLQNAKNHLGRPLRYSDLHGDGILADSVEHFTFFKTAKANDAFLKLLNHTDGTPNSFPEGDGLLENLRPFSHLPSGEKFGDQPPPSLDEEDYSRWLKRSKAAKMSSPNTKKHNYLRTYKDDYLAFCIYVRAGPTQEFAAALCGIGGSHMSDIFYAWANVLDEGLREMFPRPTRSQMLQAYPLRFIEADNSARTFMLLDAFEVFAQSSSNPHVRNATHSDYKKHSTVKCLGGCDPIGCPWDNSITEGRVGRASDTFFTISSKILREVPCGGTAKVDKGFPVDNEAVKDGVKIDRPAKRKRNQVKQSSVDTSQTQKIGNTRIVVENVNGEMKLQIRMLNVLIPCNQFSIISQIIRIGYLLQNFKKPIVQRIGGKSKNKKSSKGRCCRGEVRWYGGKDDGLVDVRPNIRLWGMQSEINRHAELTELHPGKSALEISEMVLAEDWPLKIRKELYERRGEVYDGLY